MIVIGGDNTTVILLLHQLVEILIEQVEVVQVGGNGAAPFSLAVIRVSLMENSCTFSSKKYCRSSE